MPVNRLALVRQCALKADRQRASDQGAVLPFLGMLQRGHAERNAMVNTRLAVAEKARTARIIAANEPAPVILVVDDGESSRYAIRRHLERAGYAVREAGTVAEALRAMRVARPELVLLDVALPDGNGVELCRRWRADPATAFLPIIQISAEFTRGDDYARGLDSGADSYLFQPIEPTILLATVRSLLRARQAELAQARLAAIVENADEPIISKDLNGIITSWNLAAQRLFGFSAAEAIGHPIGLITPPELRSEEQELRECLAHGERIDQLETVRVDRKGRRIDVLLTVSPIRDERGHITGASAIIRDITRRKRAEEALRGSETRLKSIIENLHEGLIVVNPEGTALHWNRMALEMHGYSTHEEVLGDVSKVKELYDFLTLKGEPVPFEHWPIPRLLREGTLRNYELLVRHKHKDWQRVLSFGGLVLPRGKGVDSLGLLTIRDITDQKRAEEALRRSEERYRCFVQASSQVVWTMNPSGQFEGGPQAWHTYTGQSVEQARGFGWLEVVFPEDRQRVLDAWIKAAKSRAGYSVEYRLRRNDGSWRNILARGVPVLENDGAIREWIGTCTDITERKQAEQDLLESEQRFRTLADNISQFAWMADEQGRIFWYNKRWFEYTGTTLEEMQGWGWKAVHHPEHADRVVQKFRRSVETGRPWEDTFPLRAKDGGYRWFLSRALPIRDESGKTVRWFGTNTDITEQRRAEAELRENRNRLVMAQRAGRLGVFDWDMTSGKVVWTEELEALVGLAPGGFEGNYEGWASRVEPADLQRLEPLFGQWTRQRHRRVDFDFRVHRADGAVRWFTARAEIHYDSQGKPTRMIGTNADITERKNAEEALQRQAALIDLTPTAMLVRTPEGTISLWNKGAEALYGWNASEALGRIAHELLRAEFPEPLQRIRDTLRRAGQWSGELQHQTRDGRKVVVQSWWLAERGPGGEVAQILESNVDITDRKRFQRQLERLVTERTAKLREMVGDLEHFSYTITHDMRSPLRAMQGFGHMLEVDYKDRLDEPGRDYLRRIIESSQRMDHLITDALSYTKVVKQELKLGAVDAEALLRGMINSYPEFQPPGAEVCLENGIPWVIGNTAVLTQCFSNLLGNAAKFVPAGTQPRVRVWAERRQKWVRIWVEDNGIGIRREDQQRIFNMFQRLSKDYEGTGIGLALVKKGVERMRGRVGVQSEPGKGSRFWVELQPASSDVIVRQE